MIAGVSTACFYPEYTESALRRLADMGIKACEIFINSTLELEEPMLRELRSIAEGADMRVLALHPATGVAEPYLFFSSYERRFEEGLELFRRYYHAAAFLGAKIMVFHGGSRAYPIEREDYFQRFDRLHRAAAACGVELCQENVERCQSHSPAFFEAMAQALPHVRYVFDLKQALRAGEPVTDFARALFPRIAHIHISDHAPGRDCLPPFAGDFSTADFLSLMRQNGGDPGVIVEVYRENFGGYVEIADSYQQLCAALSTG